MAINRSAKYPGRFENPTPQQPQGGFKNRSTDISKDGSYLEKEWLNDWSAFFSSMLEDVGATPNGATDEVGASQYFDALKKLALPTRVDAANGWALVYSNGYVEQYIKVTMPAGSTSVQTGNYIVEMANSGNRNLTQITSSPSNIGSASALGAFIAESELSNSTQFKFKAMQITSSGLIAPIADIGVLIQVRGTAA